MTDEIATETAAAPASLPKRRARKSSNAKRKRSPAARTPAASRNGSSRTERSADLTVPYVTAYGNITRALNGIATASTPDRFTQDFLASKLGLKGGSSRPVIPFLKRVGFLNSDGTPTDLYRSFRGNPSDKAQARATATRRGFRALYEINERAHELKPADLKGLVIQATGLDSNSSTVQAIVGSFTALKTGADFESHDAMRDGEGRKDDEGEGERTTRIAGLSLGYTINLHLPPTSDIAVFNAIFKSLREHLLVE